ncbi:cytosine deaminase and related metal-dependent hydrolase [Gonapodya prolifera JEL478]|uniref:Cytosine deaminase and related metal-dependent hydrolase n=1 Tax=Gonapodya prolifera (strain JEL478) TaxID=1344416 RepID=A0A139A9T5_GONPJ|nr:cytosine deaminase and related metal-dependent hydrolase [Gonapodya prolifera JEL478]|eukprot:KXS13602.1 cytosine deaminase and related metal-dependent hydrolase [Gonapodya prolifera JEL478]
MPKLLLKNALHIVTMADSALELGPGSWIACEDGVIVGVGGAGEIETMPFAEAEADEVLDLEGCVVMPGFINTHHHMYQTLTRVLGTESELFGWLKLLYGIWKEMLPSDVRTAVQTACAELLLTGCTTSADHHYVYPNGLTLDDVIDAALSTGIRFHAVRGAMSVGESKGGLPPDSCVETEEEILSDMKRVVEKYHDAKKHAMLRIVLGPCSPFSVTPDLMRSSARLARTYPKVHLHTHLAENQNDIDYSEATFARRPGEYAEWVEWTGRDVWFAHCVKLSDSELHSFAQWGCGVSHCPSSNLRLGSGVAPVRKMLDLGVTVGLGVDGSASNDGNHMLMEARMAMLAQRYIGEKNGITARETIRVATRGGAKVLGREDDLGQIAVGYSADIIGVKVTGKIEFAGALHDPVQAVLYCVGSGGVEYSVVGGRVVVNKGKLTTVDVEELAGRHAQCSKLLLERAGYAPGGTITA